jgi:putative SOS response-associated peptidase YedK
MCSRYNLTSPPEAVRAYFKHVNEVSFPPRYNIAPTQPVGIVRLDGRGERIFTLVRWGLIPPWVKDPREFATLINARSETVAEKPSFRGALRHRRCLVPADGYYEWTGRAGAKQPHLIRPKAGGLIAFAGLWEHWLGADGSELETMAILTTAANATASAIHDRMPVILASSDFEAWLDVRPGSEVPILNLLAPAPDDLLEIVQVSKALNSSRNDSADLIEIVDKNQDPPEPRKTLL